MPRGAAVSAVLLGVLAFLAAAQVNDWIVLTLDVVPGPAPDGGIDVFAVIVAPLVEEPAKLLALFALAFLLRPRFGVRRGSSWACWSGSARRSSRRGRICRPGMRMAAAPPTGRSSPSGSVCSVSGSTRRRQR